MDLLTYSGTNGDFGSSFINTYAFDETYGYDADYPSLPSVQAQSSVSSYLFSDKQAEISVLSPLAQCRRQEKNDSKPSRKEKSLELLSQLFTSDYPMYPHPGQEILINLEIKSKQLNVERRRVYDIINVLESLDIVARKQKNEYMWKGQATLKTTLAEFKVAADRHGVATQIEKVRLYEMARESGVQSLEKIDDSVGYAAQFLEQRKKTNMQANRTICKGEKKDKSLTLMAKKFVMLLLSAKDHCVTLDVAAKILTEEDPMKLIRSMARNSKCVKSYIEKGSCEPKHFPKIRRLYDIANVLTSLNLICKEKQTERGTKKTIYRWMSFQPDQLMLEMSTLRPFSPLEISGGDNRKSFTSFGNFGYEPEVSTYKPRPEPSFERKPSVSSLDKFRAFIKTPGFDNFKPSKRPLMIKKVSKQDVTFCLLPGSSYTYPNMSLPNGFKLNLKKLSLFEKETDRSRLRALEKKSCNNLEQFADSPSTGKLDMEGNEQKPENTGDEKIAGCWKEMRVTFPKVLAVNGQFDVENCQDSVRSPGYFSNNEEDDELDNFDDMVVPLDLETMPYNSSLSDSDRDKMILDTVNSINNTSEDCRDLSSYLFSVNGNNGPVSPLTAFPMTIPSSTDELVRPIGITWAPNATMEPKMCLDQWVNYSEFEPPPKRVALSPVTNITSQNFTIPPVDQSFMQPPSAGSSTWMHGGTPGISESMDTLTPAPYQSDLFPNATDLSFQGSNQTSFCNEMGAASKMGSCPTPSGYEQPSPVSFYHPSTQDNAINLSQHPMSPASNSYNPSNCGADEFINNLPSFSAAMYGYSNALTDNQISAAENNFNQSLIAEASSHDHQRFDYPTTAQISGQLDVSRFSYEMSRMHERSVTDQLNSNCAYQVSASSTPTLNVEGNRPYAQVFDSALVARAAALCNSQHTLALDIAQNAYSFPGPQELCSAPLSNIASEASFASANADVSMFHG